MNISVIRKSLSVGLTGCLLTSCAYGPVSHDHLTRRPTTDNLAGRYQLIYLSANEAAMHAIEMAVQERHQTPTIVLRADSSFEFINVPSFSRSENGRSFRFAGMSDATGRWSVAELGTAADIFGRKVPYYGLHLDGVDDAMSTPSFDRSPHHHLEYSFVAADAVGPVMTFCPSRDKSGGARKEGAR